MMEAIILAGGLGTRLGDKTKEIPKPMLPVGGRPFLDTLLDYWRAQGIDHFVLGVGHKHEVIESHIGNDYKGSYVSYSIEKELLGTGGGLLMAVKRLKTSHPFLVLNGDTFFEVSLKALAHFHEEKEAECSMSLFKISDADRYEGIQMDDSYRVESVLGRDQMQTSPYANGGVYLMTFHLVDEFVIDTPKKQSLETDLFPEMLSQGKDIYGFVSGGRFLDIGTPEDYARSADILNERKC
ncbi:MAG: sugar phosphate nucleotidyltransferase [Candidatus Omnitrophota bacterium]|nr:sugar phosphate nucleotidyltransferase [Candidatus Omnitrophota bacterium]